MKGRNDYLLEPKLAWRNVWKNKRRTVLTLLTIVVGCGMIIFMNAIATGGHEQMITDAVEINTGHIQIHEKGFWENQSIDYAFVPDDDLLKMLSTDERIAAITKRVNAGALLSFGNNTYAAMVQAVDPEYEKKVTVIHEKILEGGRYLNVSDRTGIVVGKVLAKNLGVAVGDEVSMISQGFDGSIAADNLTIVGLFDTGNPELDQALVIMPLARAMETFTMMGYINSIAVRLKSVDDMPSVRSDIMKRTDAEEIEVMGWDGLMPELVQFIIMDDAGAYITDFILLMIVAFGILNTIQMSVYERIREFGVMLAIGTRPSQVRTMILYESVFISLIGIALGLLLGSAVSYYFSIHPIDYSDYAEEMKVWGMSTLLFPARITALNLWVTSLFILVLAFVFSFFPAQRASKLRPIEAIRHL
ncbi:MAG TPA: ABC transporter permease [Spirochaetota bacterium]|nr:ABC transporter permease [Spirochaetota bacterium]